MTFRRSRNVVAVTPSEDVRVRRLGIGERRGIELVGWRVNGSGGEPLFILECGTKKEPRDSAGPFVVTTCRFGWILIFLIEVEGDCLGLVFAPHLILALHAG